MLYADDQFAHRFTQEEMILVDCVQDELTEYCGARIWYSIVDEDAVQGLRQELGDRLEAFCRIVARSEKAVYDKRACTLTDSHPLALQVKLETGVANGVLVVRTIADCAELLRRILLSDMEFSLEDVHGMWHLRERVSGCIYRVVTSDRKLNNCFWNFYLR